MPLRRVWQAAKGAAVLIGTTWIFSLRAGSIYTLAFAEKDAALHPHIINEYPDLEEAGLLLPDENRCR